MQKLSLSDYDSQLSELRVKYDAVCDKLWGRPDSSWDAYNDTKSDSGDSFTSVFKAKRALLKQKPDIPPPPPPTPEEILDGMSLEQIQAYIKAKKEAAKNQHQ